ncbi:MAG TPA: sensor domain-containing diguanylate cyclase [Candidatus Omnitrophica bacterium]|nr:sensor domain-containing diguanylate cyclase [Candidatus Omnitrophota bacterium]
MEENLQKEIKLYHQKLQRLESELSLLYEVSNAMRTTLDLDEILYIILTAITAHAGLGFNRALLFLVNEDENCLEGKMAIGPGSAEEAGKIWSEIDAERMSLEDLIACYEQYKNNPSQLDQLVKSIKIPLREDGGILALAAMEGMPIEVLDEEVRSKINDLILDILKADYFVIVPLKAKDKVIGVIFADNIYSRKPITKDDIKMLTMFANHAGLAIENSKLYQQTLYLSYTDSLTRIYNHGRFQYLLEETLKEAKEKNQPLSLILMDIDNFKNYNDNLGHPAGDEVIKKIAEIIKNSSRKQDIPARYGGEEFVLILPETSKEEARIIGERIRKRIVDYPFKDKEIQPQGAITVSMGIATFPDDAENKKELIEKADLALFAAKNKGKNQVVIYSIYLGVK